MTHFFGILLVALTVSFARGDTYPDLASFMTLLGAYNFDSDTEGLSHYLAVDEPRQPQMPNKIISPETLESSSLLWSSEDSAIIGITARPHTESAPTESGLLIALKHDESGWYVTDRIRMTAIGKYAEIRFEFSGGDHLPPPIVTVSTSNGGRGSSYQASATYQLEGTKLHRVEL